MLLETTAARDDPGDDVVLPLYARFRVCESFPETDVLGLLRCAHDRLPTEVIDRIRRSVPMGTIGEPEDVGNAVVFLVSEDARYITGQSILIDGGRWMV